MSSKTNGSTVRVATISCPYHEYAELIEDHSAGDIICTECGLVVADRVIDVSNEWRMFSDLPINKDNSRVGDSENSLSDGGDLSTMIGPPTGQASFNERGGPAYNTHQLLTRLNSFPEIFASTTRGRFYTNADRAAMRAKDAVKEMSEKLNMPKSVTDMANALYRDLCKERSCRRPNGDSLAAACLYLACRKENVPRTFKEICAVAGVSAREIGRAYQSIRQNMGTKVQTVTTEDFMARFCSGLDLPLPVQNVAAHIARRSDELGVLGSRSPITVASAAIYFASLGTGHAKSRKAIADVAGVSAATIRVACKLMGPRISELFPADYEPTIPFAKFPSF